MIRLLKKEEEAVQLDNFRRNPFSICGYNFIISRRHTNFCFVCLSEINIFVPMSSAVLKTFKSLPFQAIVVCKTSNRLAWELLKFIH